MSAIEFIRRFGERQTEYNQRRRPPVVVVIEFGGGNCNKAGTASCRDFCAVPNGSFYDPTLDPTPKMLIDQFRQLVPIRPAVVSIVPNGEAVITNQESNTSWGEVFFQQESGNLSRKQVAALVHFYSKRYNFESVDGKQAMTPAEKMALIIALGKNIGLNLSLTTNGSFLTKDLLALYREMGLEYANLSYHPNKPFDPQKYEPCLEHLMKKANEAIEVGIIPTITHVLTRQNADTFVALADYVTEHDILFAVGIANARGGGFSTQNPDIEPTDAQVKLVFRRLLARKFFADRHIRTTIPYLLMAPYLRHWVCGQATDFFHISIEKIDGKLHPQLNVCSEVRPDYPIAIGDFLNRGFDVAAYLDWRSTVMHGPEGGCRSCTHQCYFESETRGTLKFGGGIETWDWWDTFGKGARQRYTFRHPVRPVVSQRKDFQNPYLWGSFLQGIARVVAGLKDDNYWQETFRRSGVNYDNLLADLIKDAMDPGVIGELVQLEAKETRIRTWKSHETAATKRDVIFTSSLALDWHDSGSWQSRLLRAIYLLVQRSGREAKIAIPLKFRYILRRESPPDFRITIENILRRKRAEGIKLHDGILQFVKKVRNFLNICWDRIFSFGSRNTMIPRVFEVGA